MKFLLDTKVCIRFLNGRSESIRQQMSVLDPAEIALSSITKAELLFGALKGDNPQRRLNTIRPFMARFVSLPFNDDAAAIYAEIRTNLENRGLPIGPNDLLIASIAVANQLVLVTHNVREFERVNGLVIEDWESI